MRRAPESPPPPSSSCRLSATVSLCCGVALADRLLDLRCGSSRAILRRFERLFLFGLRVRERLRPRVRIPPDALELAARGVEIASNRIPLVARRIALATRGLELASRGVQLAPADVELASKTVELASSVAIRSRAHPARPHVESACSSSSTLSSPQLSARDASSCSSACRQFAADGREQPAPAPSSLQRVPRYLLFDGRRARTLGFDGGVRGFELAALARAG